MKTALSLPSFFKLPSRQKQISYFFVPLVVATVIILKVFFMPGCAAFDENDESTHTFVNLFVSREILAAGEMPMMNLYNNFGTPLLGDTLTFPFGPQALTYALLPDPYAMTVNRFVIAFLTILALTLYFSRYVSLPSASISALFVFCAPGYLWHFAHHHYQMSLLLFTAALLAQEGYARSNRKLYLFYFWASMTLLFLSTNMNPILIAIPFILANQLFLSNFRVNRKFFFILMLIAGAALFYYPDPLTFFRMIGASARVAQEYMSPIPLKSVLLSVFRWTEDFRYQHLLIASYFSIPLLAAVGIGLAACFRERETRMLAWRTLILGVVPIAGVLLLLGCWSLWTSIPLLRNTDITRFWWYSNVFLMIALGKSIDRVRSQTLSPRLVKILGIFLTAFFLLLWGIPGAGKAGLDFTVPGLLFLFCLGLILLPSFSGKIRQWLSVSNPEGFFRRAVPVLFVLSILGAQGIPFLKITGLHDWSACHTSHFFSTVDSAIFQPKKLLEAMDPYSRLACELLAVHGHDAKAVRRHVFGSNQRSVLPNKAFADYLMKEGLIYIDQDKPLSYHFKKPENAGLMSLLGIRYSVFLDRETMRAEFDPTLPFELNRKPEAASGELLLSVNPVETSIVYLMAEGNKACLGTDRVTFKGNGMKIKLPELSREQELVATFVAIPGWEALVDGKSRQIYFSENRLIRITVRPGDKEVILRYAPFRWYHFLLGILSSAGILWLILFLHKRAEDPSCQKS